MEPSKTHKKKKPLKSRINLDKLAENIDNFNFEVADFKKILNQYSIPSFNENEKEITDVIHVLKSKSHKKKPKRKLESTSSNNVVDKKTLDNFFDSIPNDELVSKLCSKNKNLIVLKDTDIDGN